MGLATIIPASALDGAMPTWDSLTSDQKTFFHAAACSVIDIFIGRRLDTHSVTEWSDGSADCFLPLQVLPVTAVTEVRLDWRGGAGQTADTFGSDTILVAGDEYVVDLARGFIVLNKSNSANDWFRRGNPAPWANRMWSRGLTMSVLPRCWGTGFGIIKIVYTAGWSSGTVPAALKSAVAEIAAYLALTVETGGLIGSSESYIDVSDSRATQMGVQAIRNGVPALGSARQILDALNGNELGSAWVNS